MQKGQTVKLDVYEIPCIWRSFILSPSTHHPRQKKSVNSKPTPKIYSNLLSKIQTCVWSTLPKTNVAPRKNRPSQKGHYFFQPFIFKSYVSFREISEMKLVPNKSHYVYQHLPRVCLKWFRKKSAFFDSPCQETGLRVFPWHPLRRSAHPMPIPKNPEDSQGQSLGFSLRRGNYGRAETVPILRWKKTWDLCI